MSDLLVAVLSFAVIAAFIIGGAGIYILLKRPMERRKGMLMLAAGIVTLLNVWLLSAPLP